LADEVQAKDTIEIYVEGEGLAARRARGQA